MHDKLKKYCKNTVPLTDEELDLVDRFFELKVLKKKDFLLQEGKICNLIGFIANGTIRHLHTKNGLEKTCDFSFENSWVTDFQSFIHNTSCIMNLPAVSSGRGTRLPRVSWDESTISKFAEKTTGSASANPSKIYS